MEIDFSPAWTLLLRLIFRYGIYLFSNQLKDSFNPPNKWRCANNWRACANFTASSRSRCDSVSRLGISFNSYLSIVPGQIFVYLKSDEMREKVGRSFNRLRVVACFNRPSSAQGGFHFEQLGKRVKWLNKLHSNSFGKLIKNSLKKFPPPTLFEVNNNKCDEKPWIIE